MYETGIEKLRAQVNGGTSTNIVVPRALLRDVLRRIEADQKALVAGLLKELGDARDEADRLGCMVDEMLEDGPNLGLED